jgi:membrane protein implicated in regulation of membrane protease activity
MIVLGLLLILIAAGAVVFAVIAPSATAETIVVTALGVKVSASPLAMFLAGAVSVVLLGIAYLLISRGARRKARSRKELRDLRKEQAATGTSTSTEGGHRSSRSDRHPKGNNTATDTGTGPDTTKAVQPDQHQESEPPSSS